MEETAEKTPIYLDQDIEIAGVVCSTDSDPSLEIRIKKRDDMRSLLHEILHLCNNIPLKASRSYLLSDPFEESVIEVATEVIFRRDKDIFEKIKRASIKGAIKYFELDGMTKEELRYLFPCCVPNDSKFRKIANYFFLDGLKESLL